MKITENQKCAMLEYLKKNNELISGKFSNKFNQKDAEERWKCLADMLNSMPGIVKDWKKWRKTWHDMRCITKSKYSKNRQLQNKTGGGPLQEETLTKVEEDILEIIKKVSVEGHENVKESIVNFNMASTSKDFNCDVQFPGNSISYPEIKDDEPVFIESPAPQKKRPLEILDTPQSGKIPKRNFNKLKNTNAAVETYKKVSFRELELKEQYYAAKIKYMEAKQQYFTEKMEAKVKQLLIKEEILTEVRRGSNALSCIAEAMNNL